MAVMTPWPLTIEIAPEDTAIPYTLTLRGMRAQRRWAQEIAADLDAQAAAEENMMVRTVDRSDPQRGLVQHAVTGERYIIEEYPVYEDGECVGSEIGASIGPLAANDLPYPEDGQPTAALFDAVAAAVNLSDEDAAWLQAESDAGSLTFPYGQRII